MLQALFRINGPAGELHYGSRGILSRTVVEGAGDAYFCFVTNQPQTLKRMGLREGTDFFVTRLYDLGYRVSTSLLTIERKTLRNRRSEMVRFLLRSCVVTPSTRPTLPTAPAWPSTTTAPTWDSISNNKQHSIGYRSLWKPNQGPTIPFWISEEAFAGPMHAVARVSGRPNSLRRPALRDMSLLEEAYQQHESTRHEPTIRFPHHQRLPGGRFRQGRQPPRRTARLP